MSVLHEAGRSPRVAVLAGGVGAARLLRGLAALVEPRRLTVVVNTGDDETFFGLHVSPDLDTVTYTLAGRAHRVRGWGLQGDSFGCLQALASFYSQTWFGLGDRDLATHIYRTEQLRRGRSLTAVTDDIRQRLGVRQRLLPMTDDAVRTYIRTDIDGTLPFQQYLVRRRARGKVQHIVFRGARRARPAPGVLEAVSGAGAVVVPPSNPLVSIGPILAVPRVRQALRRSRAPVVAVSPLIEGMAVKGPAHRMLAGLGHEVSPAGVARLYADFVNVFVLDRRDARHVPAIEVLGMRAVVTDTLMNTEARARALAACLLEAVAR